MMVSLCSRNMLLPCTIATVQLCIDGLYFLLLCVLEELTASDFRIKVSFFLFNWMLQTAVCQMHCIAVVSIPVYLNFTVTGVGARVHSSFLLPNSQPQGTEFSFATEADISKRWSLKCLHASCKYIHKTSVT